MTGTLTIGKLKELLSNLDDNRKLLVIINDSDNNDYAESDYMPQLLDEDCKHATLYFS